MINFRQQVHAGLVAIFSLLLCACSGDKSDLIKYINDMKSRPAKAIEPIPKFAPLPVFKFPENDQRRSPFTPVVLKKNADLYAPDQKRLKQPLEAFPLDALKFVGILEQDSVIWALIKQPDSQISRVRKGDYMGQNYGRIISITQEQIKLEETLKDSGAWIKKTTTLKLDAGN
ncbi:pilus assembly protein PilP [Legionella worsleiensis]|uniref:Type IV pilus biogenesis protein PilP n=1 Tax=Legionella worsleiensis TaxID=45076 RepID=A0A0W1A8Z5_9GAMM|nr:pilus assembly protein PilP [Legionella worsleiensis]KTD77831.1 type IV pilus biogenesis protein PilP [Legionella worsleiensis]STY33073.1 type IV pilus biogenesis protein PilP [Legionella worsleiensis]